MNYKDINILLTNMSTVQRTLIVVASIIVIGTLIYLLFLLYKKNNISSKIERMNTMNLVIKFKYFNEYLNFQNENKEEFSLFLVRINNLNELENKYSDSAVKLYLTVLAKELSIYLPFKGKIAQTNNRDTFIIYYPKTNEDAFDVAWRFKEIISKINTKNNVTISKASSISHGEMDSINVVLLQKGLISSIRNLGLITKSDETLNVNLDDYNLVLNKVNSSKQAFTSLKVLNLNNNSNEIFNILNINDLSFKEYIDSIPNIDQAWVNLIFIENLLSHLKYNSIKYNINVPVNLNVLEKELFNEYLELILNANNFDFNQLILSINLSSINNEDQIIKNLLTLSNFGVKLSLNLTSLNKDIYILIPRYNITRVEVNDSLMNSNEIEELLYYAKVNNLEIIYKTKNKYDDLKTLNITHITDNDLKLKSFNIKESRGRK